VELSGSDGVPGVPLLDDAVALATRLHAGQVDKAGEEYIGHPLRVMYAVAQAAAPGGVNPLHAQLAAILHDVVEDTDTTLDDLAALGYPGPVVAALDALSHRPGEPVEDYLARVAADPVAVLVKRADMADNSDPRRLSRLPPDVADRMKTRYAGRVRLLEDLVVHRQGLSRPDRDRRTAGSVDGPTAMNAEGRGRCAP
jgi:HD domain